MITNHTPVTLTARETVVAQTDSATPENHPPPRLVPSEHGEGYGRSRVIVALIAAGPDPLDAAVHAGLGEGFGDGDGRGVGARLDDTGRELPGAACVVAAADEEYRPAVAADRDGYGEQLNGGSVARFGGAVEGGGVQVGVVFAAEQVPALHW